MSSRVYSPCVLVRVIDISLQLCWWGPGDVCYQFYRLGVTSLKQRPKSSIFESHWAGLWVLSCVLSPVKLQAENPSVVLLRLGLPTVTIDYCFFFVTKRPWWQNKFSYGKLSELSDREQSFNWVLTPSLGFLMPPLFALDSAPSISIAFLLASSQVLRSQSGVFLDGWRMLQGASYPSQHQWLWSVSVAWSDKIWQPLCGSSLFVLAKKNIPSSRQSTEGGFNVFIVCLLVHIKE